jgi:serine/threonine protein kinase
MTPSSPNENAQTAPTGEKKVYPYRFGEVGVMLGILTRDQVREALRDQVSFKEQSKPMRMGEILLQRGAIQGEQIGKILDAQSQYRRKQLGSSSPASQKHLDAAIIRTWRPGMPIAEGPRRPGSSHMTTIPPVRPDSTPGVAQPPPTNAIPTAGTRRPGSSNTNLTMQQAVAQQTVPAAQARKPGSGILSPNDGAARPSSSNVRSNGGVAGTPKGSSTANTASAPAKTPKLGQFELINQVGEGSMGAVFKAFDTLNQREVALKVLPKKLAEDPEFLERFKREVQTVRQLDHPNIVAYYDAGKAGSYWYLSMEFVDGPSLNARLEKYGRFSEADSLRIARDTAQALSHAHAMGMIHRDIKPENILLTPDGIAKVTDFGLVKKQDDNSALTAVGMSIGTPFYLSPEQAMGKQDVDHRADLYSLGVTLFQLVTGRLPFEHQSAAQVMAMHVQNPPPDPRSMNPALSRTTSQLILRLMEKEPDKRFFTAEELVGVLNKVISGDMVDVSFARGGGAAAGRSRPREKRTGNNDRVRKSEQGQGCMSKLGLGMLFLAAASYLIFF